MQLPKAFIRKFKKLLGRDEASAFFEALGGEVEKGFRTNPLRRGSERFGEEAEPVPWAPGGYYGEVSGKSPAHQSGALYIQDPSAMLPATLAAAQPGEWVLDLCAAPGGKATQLAGQLGGRGVLVANDIHQGRARILSENIERSGVANALVTSAEPQVLAERFPQLFDVLLIDAPCSGEGMFRKDPEAVAQWTPKLVEECAERQRQIISDSLRTLKPGGRLVYSTCTFSPEENEQIVAWLLASHDELSLVDVTNRPGVEPGRPEWADENPELAKCGRIWPQHTRGEGHFVALFEKSPEAYALTGSVQATEASRLTGEQTRLWEEFAEATFTETPRGELILLGEHLHLVPSLFPAFDGLNVLRSGVHLGQFKKNRFEPNHAAALAFPLDMYRHQLDVGYEDYGRFVQGLTFPISDEANGWHVVCVQGMPIGWGRAVRGTLKNFFPKGLRFQALFR